MNKTIWIIYSINSPADFGGRRSFSAPLAAFEGTIDDAHQLVRESIKRCGFTPSPDTHVTHKPVARGRRYVFCIPINEEGRSVDAWHVAEEFAVGEW